MTSLNTTRKISGRVRCVSAMGTIGNIKNLFRPYPSDDLTSMDGLTAPDKFQPVPSFSAWIRDAYLDPEGPLHWPGHEPLLAARIGILWTTAPSSRRGKRIVAQAEMPRQVPGNRWNTARANHQLAEWFGFVPDFLLTFDAIYAREVDDMTFAALVDHELCHCAQAEDEFGSPRFNQATGKPVWTLKAHDVEEFTSVVERFGIAAAGEAAMDFVIAAAKRPQIGPAKLAQGCGTCLIRAA